MAQGRTIKIKRTVEKRRRRKDEYEVSIWNGVDYTSIGSVPFRLANGPEIFTTSLTLYPPGSLPAAALGYPRMLPPKFPLNDNYTKTSERGRLNAKKAILLKPNSDAASSRTFPRRTKRPADREWTWEEKAEAILMALSQKYLRHVFQHTNGRVGYMDDNLEFVPVDAG